MSNYNLNLTPEDHTVCIECGGTFDQDEMIGIIDDPDGSCSDYLCEPCNEAARYAEYLSADAAEADWWNSPQGQAEWARLQREADEDAASEARWNKEFGL